MAVGLEEAADVVPTALGQVELGHLAQPQQRIEAGAEAGQSQVLMHFLLGGVLHSVGLQKNEAPHVRQQFWVGDARAVAQTQLLQSQLRGCVDIHDAVVVSVVVDVRNSLLARVLVVVGADHFQFGHQTQAERRAPQLHGEVAVLHEGAGEQEVSQVGEFWQRHQALGVLFHALFDLIVLWKSQIYLQISVTKCEIQIASIGLDLNP